MFQFILYVILFSLLCGFVLLCSIVGYLFCGDGYFLDVDSPDANALFTKANTLFSVAKRLEKLNRGSKVYVGLRIPDPDSASRRNIDLVLVNNQEAVVLSVKNVSGSVSIDKDGNWVCTDGDHKIKRLPDPVAETKQLTDILEEYLEQRGVSLPEGHLSFKVICPNPNFRFSHSASFPPGVVTLDCWTQLKYEERNLYGGWIKRPLLGAKKKIQESFHEKLNSVLSTTPVWDWLEIKGNKHILGDFIKFKGSNDDIQASREIERSKVSRLTVQKKSMFSFDDSTVQILYASRDYRVVKPSNQSSQSGKVSFSSSTEIVFRPKKCILACKVKLSSVESLSLSA